LCHPPTCRRSRFERPTEPKTLGWGDNHLNVIVSLDVMMSLRDVFAAAHMILRAKLDQAKRAFLAPEVDLGGEQTRTSKGCP
jgi:hypothetical protein